MAIGLCFAVGVPVTVAASKDRDEVHESATESDEPTTDVELDPGNGATVVLIAPNGDAVELPTEVARDSTIELTDAGVLIAEPAPYGPFIPGYILDSILLADDATSTSEADGASGGGTTSQSPVPADAFTLHSKPGADLTIHLDFDGHVTTDTPWNQGRASSFTSEPYTRDGDPSFSVIEREYIGRIWEMVAEDFAPFDVDVTTAPTSNARLIRSDAADPEYGARVVISPSNEWYGNSGGVAYVNSFSWYDSLTPAFVFSGALGNGYWKYVAEAVSHEAGHTLGLYHDGNDVQSYYAGHGNSSTGQGWAPIMGVGYYWPTTQWSKGEYANASQSQDDIGILSTRLGWASDADPSLTNLSPLGDGDTAIGLVERSGQSIDVPINIAAGATSVVITPTVAHGNLYARAQLRKGSTVLATANPSTLSDWTLNIDRTLAAGTYTVRVTSIKSGTASTGFTTYGSIGEFKIAVEVAGDGTPPPFSPPPPQPEDDGGNKNQLTNNGAAGCTANTTSANGGLFEQQASETGSCYARATRLG